MGQIPINPFIYLYYQAAFLKIDISLQIGHHIQYNHKNMFVLKSMNY